MKKSTISILAICAVVGLSASGQGYVLNGSFESPTVPTNTLSPTPATSWQMSGLHAWTIHGLYGTASSLYPLPEDGQQYAAVGNASTLSQAFTVGNPGTFALSWFDSTEYNGAGQFSPYSVIVFASGGSTVASANFDANASGLRVWTPRSFGFTLAPGSYTLTFQGNAGVFAELSLIDNVSLVPEPSTLCLVFAAGVMLIGYRKLCKNHAV
jgi:hypothetical protein